MVTVVVRSLWWLDKAARAPRCGTPRKNRWVSVPR
jgi:hypothetical protein